MVFDFRIILNEILLKSYLNEADEHPKDASLKRNNASENLLEVLEDMDNVFDSGLDDLEVGGLRLLLFYLLT